MRLGPRRTLAVVLAAIVVIAVAVRLALDPLATWRTREVLAGLEGMDARFEDVSVSLLDLSYENPGAADREAERRRQGPAVLLRALDPARAPRAGDPARPPRGPGRPRVAPAEPRAGGPDEGPGEGGEARRARGGHHERERARGGPGGPRDPGPREEALPAHAVPPRPRPGPPRRGPVGGRAGAGAPRAPVSRHRGDARELRLAPGPLPRRADGARGPGDRSRRPDAPSSS